MSRFAGYRMAAELRGDAESTLSRGESDQWGPVLVLESASDRPSPDLLARLRHEYGLSDLLAADWATKPLALVESAGRVGLVLRDPGGVLLPASPLAAGSAAGDLAARLRLARGLAAALAQVHAQGLIHKDINPANLLVDADSGQAWITGFSLASPVPRERREMAGSPIVGTLPYIAPEQTGRMSRSIDTRSDLYSLGVTLYELFTGHLPFVANDPMEWVHCHLARQPQPPNALQPALPPAVSEIILKLLAKTAEERYQTAAGLAADLAHCLEAWAAQQRVPSFPLARQDTPIRLLVPEGLYGRDGEVTILNDALERAARGGAPELVLIAGYSGVGKSALIAHIHAQAFARELHFGGGKFDQHKRDIPYATFAQAFETLIRRVLSGDDGQLADWRTHIQEAVGGNGQVLVDLIPLLETLIGPQPPVPVLPPGEAAVRFLAVFRRFLLVFAQPGRPLVLALDDLQWIDAGSLRVLQDLMTHAEVKNLLLIGSYRSNEVSPAHPLAMTLDAIRKAGGAVEDILLPPLSRDDVARLVGDTLRATPDHVAPLAEAVHDKTGGNPFFVIQFLGSLVDEGLLWVDGAASRWVWDGDRLRERAFTDNVVDLMTARLRRLSVAAQEELHRLSCIGTAVNLSTLALVQDRPVEEALSALGDALRMDVVFNDGKRLVFMHDRVREAAYRLLPEDQRTATHLHIARRLSAGLSPAALENEIFDLVHQYNLGASLISDPAERAALSRHNRVAGRRARASTAHASARAYFRQAWTLLDATAAWHDDHAATFDLHLDLAEAEYLAGDHVAARALLDGLLERARDSDQASRVWRQRFRMFMVAGQYAEAVAVSIDALAQFGVLCPTTPEAAEKAIERLQADMAAQIGRIGIDQIDALPECADPNVRALLGLIADAIPAAYHVMPMLYPFLGLMGITLSLRHGLTENTCSAFSGYSVSLIGHYEDISTGVAFSELALRLDDRFGGKALRGTLLFRHGYFVLPWRRPIPECLVVLDESFRASLETGNLVYAAYVAYTSSWLLFEEGGPLDIFQARLHRFWSFAETSRIPWAMTILRLQNLLVAALKGIELDNIPGKLGYDDEFASFDALNATAHGHGIAFYRVIKQITPYLLGRYELSLERAEVAAEMLLKISPSIMEASHHLYSALAITALYTQAGPDRRAAFDVRLAKHRGKLKLWAENFPDTFAARHLLVEAEVARIEGHGLQAMALYEKAVAAARERGQWHCSGIANERAALFALENGFDTAAEAYLRDARYAFERWGATVKVQHLDATYPHLAAATRGRSAASAAPEGPRELDLIAVIKAQQAVSGEILLPKLVEALLRIVVEHAGADRGLLVLRQADGFEIAAEARAEGQEITVSTTARPLADDLLSLPVFHYVVRARERVVLDAGAAPGPLWNAAYAARRGVKSLFCLPVITRGDLKAVVYLENHLAAGAFTDRHVAVLDLLTTQAAISLENAILYAEMEKRVRDRTRDLAQSLDLVRTKGEHIGILLDNSDQGFMSFGADLVVGVEYSRACETMLGTMPAGQPIDRLLWAKDPAKASLVRDVVTTVLGYVDPVRAGIMLSLLPAEIPRGDKVLEAQYKLIENGRMMLVLTDVTAERRLRERVALERRNLELIVAAVTEGHDFFGTVDALRVFAEMGLEALLAAAAPPQTVLRTVYREVHTFKGLLNQFSFSALPQALHALEAELDALRECGEALTLEAIAAATRAVPYSDLLHQDLAVVSAALGQDFLDKGSRVFLTAAQVARLKHLAARMLGGQAPDPQAEEIRSLLLEIDALGKVSLKQTLEGYAPLIQRIAERSGKEAAPLAVSGPDVLVDPETFSPFLRALGHVFRNAIDHGIEPPAERRRRAKGEAGTIACALEQDGSHIRIAISDDGAGIDEAALRRRAAALQAAGAGMIDPDTWPLGELLFADGVTSREDVSETSGRGVGMAAVLKAVNDLGGKIMVESRAGQGTQFIFTVVNPDAMGREA